MNPLLHRFYWERKYEIIVVGYANCKTTEQANEKVTQILEFATNLAANLAAITEEAFTNFEALST